MAYLEHAGEGAPLVEEFLVIGGIHVIVLFVVHPATFIDPEK